MRAVQTHCCMYGLQRWSTPRVNSGSDVTYNDVGSYIPHLAYTKVVYWLTCLQGLQILRDASMTVQSSLSFITFLRVGLSPYFSIVAIDYASIACLYQLVHWWQTIWFHLSPMQLVLRVGNHLNNTTTDAKGFSLSILQEVSVGSCDISSQNMGACVFVEFSRFLCLVFLAGKIQVYWGEFHTAPFSCQNVPKELSSTTKFAPRAEDNINCPSR